MVGEEYDIVEGPVIMVCVILMSGIYMLGTLQRCEDTGFVGVVMEESSNVKAM